MKNLLKEILKPRLKLVRGTRLTSLLFIVTSMVIAARILIAANMYYNIDTGEVVTEEIYRVTGVIRATAGAIVGGTATQNPTANYVFEVVGQTKLATTTVASGQLEFSGSDTYSGFKAPSSYGTTTPKVYKLPQYGNFPPQADYILTWQPGDQLQWKSLGGAGGGDINQVGDCGGPECFTSAANTGNALYFDAGAGSGEIILTADDASSTNYTITLPAAAGTVALGTSTANYVAYWSGTNTLTGEAQLATSRGGTGQNSSAWTGMIRVNSGTWSALTNTANYVAVWDANGQFITGEQYLTTGKGGLGADVTAAGAGEILYSTGATTYDSLAAGTAWQILTSGGAAAPAWRNISELVYASNGLTAAGTATTTLKLGGALTENTTITQGNYNLIFALSGTGDFIVRNDVGTDIFTVTDDDRILFKTYPLAETGKEVLRATVQIFGFDLPSQTATTSFVQLSKTIQDYPFSDISVPSGATSTHKFIIRVAAATTTASTTWRVWNETTASQVDTFSFVLDQSTDLEKGEVFISPAISIPQNTDDWRLDLQTNGQTVRVYSILLARYDQIQ